MVEVWFIKDVFLGYSRKNPNRVDNMDGNYQGVQVVKNRMWKFHGSIKKEVKFSIKKKSCKICMGLGVWPWRKYSNGCNTILWNFQGWKSCFLSGISNNKVANLKFQGPFLKKYPCPHNPPPPVWIFSGLLELAHV